MLSESPCQEPASNEVEYLEEDRSGLSGDQDAKLCPKHAVGYLTSRASLRCSYGGCNRVGNLSKQGLRVCGAHEEACNPTPSRRSSRSRSRARDLDRPEGDGEDRLRRRGRVREVSYDTGEAETILPEVRDEKEEMLPASRRKRVASPGHAPKSSVQHSLARMGMINSPDRRGEMTYLEEFMEQLADGKELQLNEEDIRKQMAAQSGLTVGDLTKFLYEQATEEQRKGTKGLTKFLAKWRKQAAAQEGAKERESSAPTPTSAASGGRVTQSPGSVAVETPPKKRLAVVPPPGIYDPDRKAGTGLEGRGANSEMTDIAKANFRRIGVPLRACGQYTVQVGDGEYGAALAQALLADQRS